MKRTLLSSGPFRPLLYALVLAAALLLVALPLLQLVQQAFTRGGRVFLSALANPLALAALQLSLWTALVVAVINALLGTASAWVLVRYKLPGRAWISAAVDLPLAIPTLVTGVMLALLYGPESFLGSWLHACGIEIAFARGGILLALLFVTLPFVIRAVEPVLFEMDPAEEEAARMLGAGAWTTFRRVVFPAIAPAALSGAVRSLSRSLGEFGSIVVIAGNIPFSTLTAPVFIFGEIESGSTQSAAALSVVLLVLALSLHGLARFLENRTGARRAR